MLDELDRWLPAADPEVVRFLRERHRRGQVFRLGFRAVADAIEWRRLGEPWEEALEAGLAVAGEADCRLMEDVEGVLRVIEEPGLRPGDELTEHRLYDRLQGLRPDRRGGDARRDAALRYLAEAGIIERLPATRLGGRRGRPRGRAVRLLRPPEPA